MIRIKAYDLGHRLAMVYIDDSGNVVLLANIVLPHAIDSSFSIDVATV